MSTWLRADRRVRWANSWSTGNLVLGVLIVLLMVLGTQIYRDYGISWDEPQQRLIGQVSTNYILETLFPFLDRSIADVPALHVFRDKDYGVVFEVPAVLLEKAFGLEDPRDIFMMRHLLNYIVFLIGVASVFKLLEYRFGDWRPALLGAFLLVLSPRFFAESFYNTKDIVFMSFFALAMMTMMRFLVEPSVRTAALHALATGLAIDVRIMAVLIPAATLAVLSVKFLKGEAKIKSTPGLVGVYLLLTAVTVVIFFPFLWADPVGNLIHAFQSMSRFGRWGGEILYLGEHVSGYEIPWHYAPVWIAITTPPLYLLFFVFGGAIALWQAMRSRVRLWRNAGEMQDLVVLGLVVVPLGAVIALESVLYNGWRQLYFLYPALIFLLVRGVVGFWELGKDRTVARILIGALLAGTLLSVGQWMWRAHPYQNVYFNVFAGQDVRFRFELDYWGLSNREALGYILTREEEGVVDIRALSFTPLHYSVMMLRPEERARVNLIRESAGPHYLVNNYFGWKRHGDLSRVDQGYVLVHQITVNGEVILSIYYTEGN
jgi:hypothetical protein